MRKVFFMLFLMLMAAPLKAYDAQDDGLCYILNPETKEAKVTERRPKYTGAVVIPDIIVSDNVQYKVTAIDDKAFYMCDGLTSITIGNNVTSIGTSAFGGCVKLVSIDIPNSVTFIDAGAFSSCSSLTSVHIPSSVTSIGNYAFDGCTSLPVEDNIRYADTYLVQVVDKSFDHYKIKEETKFIGISAFSRCSSLTSITIPDNVTSINKFAFWDCM